jgi:hypothetical protein
MRQNYIKIVIYYLMRGKNIMAKEKKRPVDSGGIYKDGTQKNNDDRAKIDGPSETKKKINKSI